MTASAPRICVIGLGYVGLPLAVALSRRFDVVGFDHNRSRIEDLRKNVDRTGELGAAALKESRLRVTAHADEIANRDVYIIAVPTPVDEACRPDLTAVRGACRTIGQVISAGAIVVLESTVYPGATEDVVGSEIAAVSGLKCGAEFFLGYSPERINPGDKQHTVDRITKVVAGQSPAITQRLAAIYESITSGGVFIAASIKAAEAAKVIENAQRDINIAFINEVTMIFNRVGLSIHDVLAAASTKWNFLNFAPGLVGGHCIGVDPYYLADLAMRLGHDPEVILAGRRINDRMADYVAGEILAKLVARKRVKENRVLILGLTFKENVPDLRNSKVFNLVERFLAHGYAAHVHDPLADPAEARHEYGIELLPTLDGASSYDAVIGAVPHDLYRALSPEALALFVGSDGLVADIKGMWRDHKFPHAIDYWGL